MPQETFDNARQTLILTLLVWLTLGSLVNVRDQRSFSLQHAGIESLVERGTFDVRSARAPDIKLAGDRFSYNGRMLAAKQPGQFVWGAVPYLVLYQVGFSYTDDFEFVATFNAWCSSSLAVALISGILFWLVTQVWRLPRTWGYMIALCVGFGSTLTAYSGVPHHDVLAACCLCAALLALELSRTRKASSRWKYLGVAGGFLGLTVFCSMLPALLVAILFIYGLATNRIADWIHLLAGTLIGLLPLFIYNGYYFSSPLIQANIAGNYSDTFFSFRAEQILERLNTYLGWGKISLLKYSPVTLLGLIGLFALPTELKRIRYLVLTLLCVHLFYLCNIGTTGHSQVGPRYLLPLIPFLSLGLCGWFGVSRFRAIGTAILLSVFAFSAFVALMARLFGVMYRHTSQFAPMYWLKQSSLQDVNLPLLLPGLLGLGVLVLAFKLLRSSTQTDSH